MVDTVWTDPTQAYPAGLDRATSQNLPSALWDQLISNLNKLGGTTGDLGIAITKTNVQSGQLVNEIMGFPAIVPHGSNLPTLNLWWDEVATGATTFVDLITEGIAETYGRWALKHVAAASGDGPKEVFTYANQPRVKSGRKLSHLYAIYIVTAARSVTPKVLNSDASVSTGTVISTVGSWVLGAIEDHTLAGASTDVRWTMDGAGTFYVVPLGTCIGTKAFALPPRPTRWVDGTGATVVNAVDPGAAGFTDVDCTSVTSPLAFRLWVSYNYTNLTTADKAIQVRRNGDATTALNRVMIGRSLGLETAAAARFGGAFVFLDDGQVFEYQTAAAAGDVESLSLFVHEYEEWG